jgi:hypothetical protein
VEHEDWGPPPAVPVSPERHLQAQPHGFRGLRSARAPPQLS